MMITFYPAGKTWHAPKFQMLRDMGWPVNARWIDLDSESDFVRFKKGQLWEQCRQDVASSSFVLFYSEDMAEEQRGALVEVGMAFGMGKPVFAIGRCKTIVATGTSDVAFTHHPLWHWVDSSDLIRGTSLAVAHYLELCKHRKVA